MLDFNKIYLVNSQISKEVTKNIINNQRIDFNKLQGGRIINKIRLILI